MSVYPSVKNFSTNISPHPTGLLPHSVEPVSVTAHFDPCVSSAPACDPHIATTSVSDPAYQKVSIPSGNSHGLMTTSQPRCHNFDVALLGQHSSRVSKLWPDITPAAADEFPDFASCYNAIKVENCHNFLGAKITLNSALNLEKWEEELAAYHDREICLFLRYGWPVGYELDSPPTSVEENHHSGQQHLTHVRNFIQKELGHGAIIGPFTNPPFHPWTRISPILTRPKKDSTDRRIIIDLSFPKGNAVNNGIDINSIFGRDSSYVLPTISDFTTMISHHGPRSWM